jgi:hypothetical protein
LVAARENRLQLISGGHDERCVNFVPRRFLLAIRSFLADNTDEAHGMAARRFGLMVASHSTQLPKVPASKRRSAARTSRTRLESRSIFPIAIALAGVLDSVQLIRTGLDQQSFAVPVPFS